MPKSKYCCTSHYTGRCKFLNLVGKMMSQVKLYHLFICPFRYSNLLCGKRKHSMRERSVDCEGLSASGRAKASQILAVHKMTLSGTNETHMDFDSAAATHW